MSNVIFVAQTHQCILFCTKPCNTIHTTTISIAAAHLIYPMCEYQDFIVMHGFVYADNSHDWINNLSANCPDITLHWRHNVHDSVSNHQPRDCLFNRLFTRRSKKTSKLRVAGLCARNTPGTGEFPAQMASIAENVSIWWRHHERLDCILYFQSLIIV